MGINVENFIICDDIITLKSDNILFNNVQKKVGEKNEGTSLIKDTTTDISVVEDIELKEAEALLVGLSRKRFFWNKALRLKAKEVLRKWNVK